MAMPHEIADEPGILMDLARPLAVGDARRLNDGAIIAHIVDDPHEAVVEHRDRLVKDLLERCHRRPPRRLACAAQGIDLRTLFRVD